MMMLLDGCSFDFVDFESHMWMKEGTCLRGRVVLIDIKLAVLEAMTIDEVLLSC
jgi:hypothetical protein